MFFLLAALALDVCLQDDLKPKQPRPADTEAAAALRKQFLEAPKNVYEEAKNLVLSGNPRNIDSVVAFFIDEDRAYDRRIEALRALRLMATGDSEEYARVYPAVKGTLSKEASKGMKKDISETEIQALVEALNWHTDMKYEHARMMCENYLNPEILEKVSVPLRIRQEAARCLGKYSADKQAEWVVWKTVQNAKEDGKVRSAALDALKQLRGKQFRDLLKKLEPAPEDAWLKDEVTRREKEK